ncbi:Protein FAM172A [Nymphon striatum]|nr:Protein FAM172A [Nymphon striatum]
MTDSTEKLDKMFGLISLTIVINSVIRMSSEKIEIPAVVEKKQEPDELEVKLKSEPELVSEDDVMSAKKSPTIPVFPSTLEEFDYKFNNKGELLSISTNEPFIFNVRDGDHDYNQQRYEKLGDIITDYVYDALENDLQLTKVNVPVDATENEPHSFFFMTDDALTNKEKLLILVHGSGVVRAGQWSRRLIINDCLDSGTQFPFIKRARDEDYGVIVLNTNDNYRIIDQTITYIRGSDRPEHHIRYVWDHFIKHAKAKYISFIAHSYGGVAFFDLASNRYEEMKSRVSGVAFTDSVHGVMRISPTVTNWIHNSGCNWVASNLPLDTPVINRRLAEDVPCVSAGHPRHDTTSWSSFSSIFTFLDEKRKQADAAESNHEEL